MVKKSLKKQYKSLDKHLLRYEKIPTLIYEDAISASQEVAKAIAKIISSKKGNCVLGLPTGSTPIFIYEELIRLHEEEGLSFKNVITFNLDEYYPMPKTKLQSYVRFMNENFFDHIDIPKENINIPDGSIPVEDIHEYCDKYEQKIADAGGIDIQLLGIGKTGHIGFNEPGSPIDSRTRLITLDHVTRVDAASDFFGEDNVPKRAITMGIGTIFSAKTIFLLAWGEAPRVGAGYGRARPGFAGRCRRPHRNAVTCLPISLPSHASPSKFRNDLRECHQGNRDG